MKPRDILLTLSVPLIWGLGFTLAKAALGQFPPILVPADVKDIVRKNSVAQDNSHQSVGAGPFLPDLPCRVGQSVPRSQRDRNLNP